MALRNAIIGHLDDLLEIGSFSDYGPKRLLVPGARWPWMPTPRWVTNALIGAELGFEQAEPFSEFKGRTIGFVGRSAEGPI